MVRMTTEERFWSKVPQNLSDDECWLWQGEKHVPHGYGLFRVYADGKSTKYLAHRMMLERKLGRELLDTEVARHKVCDNPPCVNPAHLQPGTQADNMRDMHEHGRADMSGLKLGLQARWDKYRNEVAKDALHNLR